MVCERDLYASNLMGTIIFGDMNMNMLLGFYSPTRFQDITTLEPLRNQALVPNTVYTDQSTE